MARDGAMIGPAEVAHIARLARLSLSPAEQERMQAQLAAILTYIEKLRALDTTAVEPTSHAVPLVNVLREDEPRPCLSPEEMLANAPDRVGELFRVPRIIEAE